MQIAGIEDRDGRPGVHTIDVWFSERRKAWVVERLDADGHQVGLSHRCDSAAEAEAEACLQEWLRAHGETHLVAPRETTPAERHMLARAARHAA